MPNTGSNAPDKIPEALLKLKLSDIRDGVHAATPSRNMPHKTIAHAIMKNTGVNTFAFVETGLCSLVFSIKSISGQYICHKNIIMIPQIALKKNTPFQPAIVIITGARM